GLRLKDDAVAVGAGFGAFDLLGKVRHVVREAQEMSLVGTWTCFACDGSLAGSLAIAQRTSTNDLQHVLTGDTVVEDNAALYLKLISRFGQVTCGHVRIR